MAQKDGSVPFWQYSGNAIANEEMLRVTPSLKSQSGQVWTKNSVNFDWWEVEMIFRVTGRGRIGADGLAFWYTEERGTPGPVFGSNDMWKGLGIFFDSFDNDNKHNNPYIMAMVNDGTKVYDHKKDGSSQQIAGCLRDFRNKPFPVRAKIEYYKNALTVYFQSGMTNNEKEYELCFRSENVILPKGGYFGITAATGGLADDHDVLKFLTNSLTPPEVMDKANQRINQLEQEKLAKEYERYQENFQKQKDEYRKENPNAPKEETEDGEWFESDQQRELNQIFLGQSQIFDHIRDMHRKLDEIVGRQERSMVLLSQTATAATGGGLQGVQPVGIPAPEGIRRNEVDQLLVNQREVMNIVRDLKAYVNEVHSRTGTIIQNQSKQPAGQAQVQTFGYDHVMNSINDIKEGIHVVKRDVSSTAQKMNHSCPQCLSMTFFLIFGVVQTLLFVVYFVYRDNKESQAKKFY